jgi:hypothetical protein
MVINYTSLLPAIDARTRAVVNAADALLDEAGFSNGGGCADAPFRPFDCVKETAPDGTSRGFFVRSGWLDRVQMFRDAQRLGKPVYLVNELVAPQASDLSPSDLDWIIASYMLAKEHALSFSLAHVWGGTQYYGVDLFDPANHLVPMSPTDYLDEVRAFGPACGPLADHVDGAGDVKVRRFANGIVLANVSPASTYAVTLDGGTPYVDRSGATKTGITLPPHSGAYLRRAAGLACPW